MGIYTNNKNDNQMDEQLQDVDLLNEAMIYLELSSNLITAQEIDEYIRSKEAKTLLETGAITKKTLVRLTKNDDLTRRITMASFQLAKENDDPLWNKLAINRMKERDLISKIVAKYGSKGTRAAKNGQKDYLKNNKGFKFGRIR